MAPAIYGTDAPNWGQVQGLVRQADRGSAMTMAMAAQITPSAPGKTTLSLGVGAFAGEVGTSLNVVYRASVSFPLFISGGVAASDDGNWGGRVGIGIEF